MEMVISNKAIAVLSPGSGDGAYFGKASQLGMLDLYKERLRWLQGKNAPRPFLANTCAPATGKRSL
jgi:aminoglycoside phosphotransferase